MANREKIITKEGKKREDKKADLIIEKTSIREALEPTFGSEKGSGAYLLAPEILKETQLVPKEAISIGVGSEEEVKKIIKEHYVELIDNQTAKEKKAVGLSDLSKDIDSVNNYAKNIAKAELAVSDAFSERKKAAEGLFKIIEKNSIIGFALDIKTSQPESINSGATDYVEKTLLDSIYGGLGDLMKIRLEDSTARAKNIITNGKIISALLEKANGNRFVGTEVTSLPDLENIIEESKRLKAFFQKFQNFCSDLENQVLTTKAGKKYSEKLEVIQGEFKSITKEARECLPHLRSERGINLLVGEKTVKMIREKGGWNYMVSDVKKQEREYDKKGDLAKSLLDFKINVDWARLKLNDFKEKNPDAENFSQKQERILWNAEEAKKVIPRVIQARERLANFLAKNVEVRRDSSSRSDYHIKILDERNQYIISHEIQTAEAERDELNKERDNLKKPWFFAKLFKTKRWNNWQENLSELNDNIEKMKESQKGLRAELNDFNESEQAIKREIGPLLEKCGLGESFLTNTMSVGELLNKADSYLKEARGRELNAPEKKIASILDELTKDEQEAYRILMEVMPKPSG